jgi:hypothetical protein
VSFARRLILGVVLVLLVTVGTLVWIAERSLRRNLEGDIEQGLEHEARLVRAALPADSLDWQDVVRRLGAATDGAARRRSSALTRSESSAGEKGLVR